ncbi:hypothetical protein LX36DRAFT_707586 [Colletotrichum falcatum]|nr:hypothetical protein LX36DRAFT_707586 [Colletotrichum falcatum]
MDPDMTLQGIRLQIRFSLPENAPGTRWEVKCQNSAALTRHCRGSLQISPTPGDSTLTAINRSIERLGIKRVGIDLRPGSEDKVILTGFGKYYKKYQEKGWPIPDLDDDMTEFLSRFNFVVFLITRTVLLSRALLYSPETPEFPGVNFAKVVKSCPSQAVSIANRKCIVIYTSTDHLGYPLKPISLYDLVILDQDPDFNFLRSFNRTYDFCVAQSRNQGEDLPKLIYGHDDGSKSESSSEEDDDDSVDESCDELML